MATFELDQASGVMIPFYDDDTRMLYLTGKVRACGAKAQWMDRSCKVAWKAS